MTAPVDSPGTVAAALRGLRRAVVLSHYHPDPDAYGAQCACALALESLGIETANVNESGVMARYRYLPGSDRIVQDFPAGAWDGAVVLDCADLKRVGDRLAPAVGAQQTIINIDHHISNDFFGRCNLVHVESSSSCEVLYELLLALSVPITADIAACLYTGLVGDTGFFKYPSTSARTLEIAAELVRAGARPAVIAEHVAGNVSLAAMRLHGAVLSSLDLKFQGRYAVGIVQEELYRKFGATPEDTEGLVEQIRDIEGVSVAAFIRWENGLWKVSLRSRDKGCNVSDLAAEFGGGGHIMAAAFRFRQSLDELCQRLEQAVGRVLGAV